MMKMLLLAAENFKKIIREPERIERKFDTVEIIKAAYRRMYDHDRIINDGMRKRYS